MNHCEDENCTFNKYVTEQLVTLNKPITGEVVDSTLLLIRNNEVIGNIPNISFPYILDAFGNQIPLENVN